MAAWLALDPCDEENGCMRVVPGSHTWPILCTTSADTDASFTNVTVPIPVGQEVRPIIMEAGRCAVLQWLPGAWQLPEHVLRIGSAGRLIGHYIEAKAEQVTKFDQPVLKMDGTAFEIDGVEEGGPCGVFVERDGGRVIEMAGRQLLASA